jgi:predicted dehydrogenase
MNQPASPSDSKKINRREFIATSVTASAAFNIVPRHVLGGSGFIPPSDKLTLAYIGCGTQGMREMAQLITNPKIQITSVCDPNKLSTDYIDWSPTGIRDSIRKVLNEPSWGANYNGIPGGRDIGQEFVEKYYSKNNPDKKYKGCRSYEDFRELLDKEKDVDAWKIMTPDHLHATISIAAMKKGKHIVIHKPIANRMKEARLVIDTTKATQAMDR